MSIHKEEPVVTTQADEPVGLIIVSCVLFGLAMTAMTFYGTGQAGLGWAFALVTLIGIAMTFMKYSWMSRPLPPTDES